MTENLSFTHNKGKMLSKAFKVLGFIKRNSFSFKEPSTLLTLFKALVRPLLEYASVIWNSDAKCFTEEIERVQKKFVKYFCYKFKIQYDAINYENLCQQIGLPPLYKRRIFLDMVTLYKIVNCIFDCPELLSTINLRIPTFDSRNKQLFHIPNARTNVRKNSPEIRIMNNYNELLKKHEDLDIFQDLPSFKQMANKAVYARMPST